MALVNARFFAAAEERALGGIHFATSDSAARESGWFDGAAVAGENAADLSLRP